MGKFTTANSVDWWILLAILERYLVIGLGLDASIVTAFDPELEILGPKVAMV